MKKSIVCFLLVVSMVFSSCLPAFAAEGAEVTEPVMVGVSPFEPDMSVVPFTTDIPTNVWNISTQGYYTFGGSSIYQTLYTNYVFNGRTTYTVYVANTSDKLLTVQAKTRLSTFVEVQIPAHDSLTFKVVVPKTSTNMYLRFSGTYYSFSGYIM